MTTLRILIRFKFEDWKSLSWDMGWYINSLYHPLGGKSEKKLDEKSTESSSKEETAKEKSSGIVTSSSAEPTPAK